MKGDHRWNSFADDKACSCSRIVLAGALDHGFILSRSINE